MTVDWLWFSNMITKIRWTPALATVAGLRGALEVAAVAAAGRARAAVRARAAANRAARWRACTGRAPPCSGRRGLLVANVPTIRRQSEPSSPRDHHRVRGP